MIQRLRRYGLGLRLALLSGLLLSLSLVLAGLLARGQLRQLGQVELEQQGLAYRRALAQLEALLPLPGAGALGERGAAWAELEAQQKSGAKALGTVERFELLGGTLAELGPKPSRAQLETARRAALELGTWAVESSGLLVSQDLAVHYGSDVVVTLLPALLMAVEQLANGGAALELAQAQSNALGALAQAQRAFSHFPAGHPGFSALDEGLGQLAAAVEQVELEGVLPSARRAQAQKAREGLLRFQAALYDDISASLARRAARLSRGLAYLGLALLAYTALAALAALAIARSVIDPVMALAEATRRVAEEGDLTQALPAAAPDEVGRLAADFAILVERLKELPQALAAQASQLGEAVASMESLVQAQNAVLTRQATALQETQVTAEEIRQTSQVASRSADKILAEIGQAEAAGEQGHRALEQSLEGLEVILESARGTARSINELGERTRQIGGITSTVKDLADQSNMLALNAAIEAVRSGEHGKGFALVAREIRRLADQSIQSTERVREILESVRGAVGTAVAGSEDGARQVELSLARMRASADHLRALANVVQDSSAAVRQIATAINQQNTGVNQVFAAVVDQNKMMEESVKQLDGTLRAVESLRSVSNGLAAVLARYKA